MHMGYTVTVAVGCRLGTWKCHYWSISESKDPECGRKDVLFVQHWPSRSSDTVCDYHCGSVPPAEIECGINSYDVLHHSYVPVVRAFPGICFKLFGCHIFIKR